MKTPLAKLSVPLTAGLLAAASAIQLQGQPYANDLVTVTTNAPATPMPAQSARTPFVLQPLGIVKEVLKLQASATDPSVIRAFIQGWSSPYSVTADDVLRLHNAGIPPETLTFLIQHGAELGAQASAMANTSPPQPGPMDIPPAGGYPGPEPGAPAPETPVAPAEGYTYTYPQYVPTPVYTAPVYPYTYGYIYAGPAFYGRSYGHYQHYQAVHHFPPPRPFGGPVPGHSAHSGFSGH